MTMHGVIKIYDPEQGRGWITPYDRSRDIAFRASGLSPDFPEQPREGMRVSYDENSETDRHGRSIATDVEIIK